MTEEEEAVAAFLAARDLVLLNQKPLVFGKSREFIKSEHRFALKWFMWLGCVPCLAPIATFKFDRLYGQFALELHRESLRVSAPVNWFCSVKVEHSKLLLESIVDITLSDDQYCQPYGLKQMHIWAYGDTEKTGPTVSVSWVSNPGQARDAIMLAVNLRKAEIGFVPLPVPTTPKAPTNPLAATTPTTAADQPTASTSTAPTAPTASGPAAAATAASSPAAAAAAAAAAPPSEPTNRAVAAAAAAAASGDTSDSRSGGPTGGSGGACSSSSGNGAPAVGGGAHSLAAAATVTHEATGPTGDRSHDRPATAEVHKSGLGDATAAAAAANGQKPAGVATDARGHTRVITVDAHT